MKFQDYLDEQMRDPEFRFWWYVYEPGHWLRSKLAMLLMRASRSAHAAALLVLGMSIVAAESEESDDTYVQRPPG